MLPIESFIIRLLKEQKNRKAEFDLHVQFDYLGIDDSTTEINDRYVAMKNLAKRIIQIESFLDVWVDLVPIADLELPASL